MSITTPHRNSTCHLIWPCRLDLLFVVKCTSWSTHPNRWPYRISAPSLPPLSSTSSFPSSSFSPPTTRLPSGDKKGNKRSIIFGYGDFEVTVILQHKSAPIRSHNAACT